MLNSFIKLKMLCKQSLCNNIIAFITLGVIAIKLKGNKRDCNTIKKQRSRRVTVIY